MTFCYCPTDDEPANIYATKAVRAARKAHRCYECQGPVLPGEAYERAASLYDGRWTVACTCTRCLDARNYVEAHAPCFCWRHGSMLDDARDVAEQYGRESAGFFIGAMKRIRRAEKFALDTRVASTTLKPHP